VLYISAANALPLTAEAEAEEDANFQSKVLTTLWVIRQMGNRQSGWRRWRRVALLMEVLVGLCQVEVGGGGLRIRRVLDDSGYLGWFGSRILSLPGISLGHATFVTADG